MVEWDTSSYCSRPDCGSSQEKGDDEDDDDSTVILDGNESPAALNSCELDFITFWKLHVYVTRKSNIPYRTK